MTSTPVSALGSEGGAFREGGIAERRRRILGQAAFVLIGSLLLALSAKVQVPLWPVPVTLQTLAVLAVAMWGGARLGAAAVLLYGVEGFAGLPVFAGAASGPAYLLGATGGYLLGFLVAALVVGGLAERGWRRSLPRLAGAMLIGHALILACGVAWLSVLVGPGKAIATGLLPFLWGTLVKSGAGVALLRLTPRFGPAGRPR
jgi:biotin transport system substrate-specific component